MQNQKPNQQTKTLTKVTQGKKQTHTHTQKENIPPKTEVGIL